MRKRITSAHVLALVAIVLAVGGNAFAFTLGKNSVGTKQLKKNSVTTKKIKKEAVTAAKVKKGTLTGTQINASTLGTVPTANTAQTANIANSVAPSEAWHELGAPGEPKLQNNWKNSGGSTPTAAFYKDHEGIVHMRGVVVGSPEEAIFFLPPGYRPASGKTLNLGVICTGCSGEPVSLLHIYGDGLVSPPFGPGGVVVFLEDITFRAES